MQDLLEAGVHFGHQVRRGHPKMQEYIFGVRDGVHIINLESSEKLLKEAAEYANKLGKEGKILLFVGTKKQAQPLVQAAVQEAKAPFISDRWVGGLLTNFDEVKKNIKKLQDLKEKKEKGELTRYTKKEQLLISRKLEKFDKVYGGVVDLEKLPDAIFLTDCVGEKTALAESLKVGIPVIAIADTNCNPLLLDYPIPGNDDATKSIKVILDTISGAYGQGLGNAKAEKKEEPKQEKNQPKVEEKTEEKPDEGNSQIAAEIAAAEEAVEAKSVEEADRAV
jgi:small subunit ribosomal protein S2